MSRNRPTLWVVIHWIIIVNFLFEIFYTTAMVFFVLRPEGAGIGPLWGQALTMDPQRVMIRRMYANEGWLAIGGLAIYLAITEIQPRFWRREA